MTPIAYDLESKLKINLRTFLGQFVLVNIYTDAAAFVNVVEDTNAVLSKVGVGFKLREGSKTLSACLIRVHCSMSSLNLDG